MVKKFILSALFFCAFCVALPPTISFAADQDRVRDQLKDPALDTDQEPDQDQTKDQLKDGSCQLTELLQDLGAL